MSSTTARDCFHRFLVAALSVVLPADWANYMARCSPTSGHLVCERMGLPRFGLSIPKANRNGEPLPSPYLR